MVKTHADWLSYLARGHKKYERTLYDRGYRIRRANKFKQNGDLQIYTKWMPSLNLVTIHTDDTITIDGSATMAWGSYPTPNPLGYYSNRLTIMRYAGISLFVKNFELKIREENAGLTPTKIQGCRQCKQTGLQDMWCYPSTCYDPIPTQDGKWICPTHPGVGVNRWHRVPCPHNNDKNHMIKDGTDCYYCQGTKKRDYGSKFISIPWDGSPLKVKDGKIYRQPLTELERIVASYVGPTT